MIVELDQPREDRSANVDARGRLETDWRRLRRVVHCDDAALIDVNGAAAKHAERVVHRDDLPRQRKLRSGKRIDGRFLGHVVGGGG